MRRLALFAGLCWVAAFASAAPRVTFYRTIPPPHELGGEVLALIYAIGDNDQVDTFVDTFAQHVNRSELLQLTIITDRKRHLFGNQPDAAAFARLRREHPADIYLGVNHFTCTADEKHGVGHAYTPEGDRVTRAFVWVDSECSARVDVMNATSAKRTLSFEVKGEGTSPHVSLIRDEERSAAMQDATRVAAIQAAEMITPRRVRESIELEDSAPAFDQGWALIESSRLSEARTRWENALKKERRPPAALHYNIAAVCEALGDTAAAQEHYEQAQRLAPDNSRYRAEITMFRMRSGRK